MTRDTACFNSNSVYVQVIWVDLLTEEEFNAGFGSHTPMFTGQTKCVRYYMNFERALGLHKKILAEVNSLFPARARHLQGQFYQNNYHNCDWMQVLLFHGRSCARACSCPGGQVSDTRRPIAATVCNDRVLGRPDEDGCMYSLNATQWVCTQEAKAFKCQQQALLPGR